ncbi:N-acetylmuramoyl-L-alanine amidase [Nesterenkonia flava]|uniref:N-acetylmuramoyl-L-alanine amidase n=1 Tax=Nesterenkonia flava TaxID=469799 RepID=A0ABU1FUZ7_9MICC|nr:N-acetylmuramoyl-L-alanine amidase [Nesterenkonia flava]MDR5712490.1 N-acetylmuramoyl-L-alanine amidase [Nesterenkonia flava]
MSSRSKARADHRSGRAFCSTGLLGLLALCACGLIDQEEPAAPAAEGEASSPAPEVSPPSTETSSGEKKTADSQRDSAEEQSEQEASDEDVAEEEPALEGVHIALDPGHAGGIGADPARAFTQVPDGRGGFKDCQAVGAATNAGYPEHAFNWDVSVRLVPLLEADGAEVSLTRQNDTDFGPCVDERGQFPQNVGADVYVSIHANGSDPYYAGYFAIISDPPLNPAQGEPSSDLAWHLMDGLAEEGFAPSNQIAGGVMARSDIAGLNWAEVPAVMMELGEMRNAEEAAVMETEEGRQRYAEALHAGLVSWSQAQSQEQSAAEAEEPPA